MIQIALLCNTDFYIIGELHVAPSAYTERIVVLPWQKFLRWRARAIMLRHKYAASLAMFVHAQLPCRYKQSSAL